MPRGEPNRQTLATEKYQRKAGYKVKSFKLKGDVADEFAETCERIGVSQAQQITKLMRDFIEQNKE